MENEPLLDNLRFKIKTDSLLLNYKYNSIDSSLDDYLTFPFKNIPIVGDIIDFEDFYSDTSEDNLVEEFLIDFKTATFKVIERGCWVAKHNYPYTFKEHNWVILLEPCLNFKKFFTRFFDYNIGKELISNFKFSSSTCDTLQKLHLYESTTLDVLTENFDSIKSHFDETGLLEISELILYYSPIKKVEEEFRKLL